MDRRRSDWGPCGGLEENAKVIGGWSSVDKAEGRM